MCEYIWVPVKARRRCQSPWNLEYSVSAGNSTPSPLEGQRVFNHWATSPAFVLGFLVNSISLLLL